MSFLNCPVKIEKLLNVSDAQGVPDSFADAYECDRVSFFLMNDRLCHECCDAGRIEDRYAGEVKNERTVRLGPNLRLKMLHARQP